MDTDPDGEALLQAAEAKKAADGYVFTRPNYFLEDDQLLHLEGKTMALSKQWGIESLPMIDEIASILPSDETMTYTKTQKTP